MLLLQIVKADLHSEGPVARLSLSFFHDLSLYPLGSTPAAVQALSRHPAALSDLIRFTALSATAIRNSKGKAADACRAALQVCTKQDNMARVLLLQMLSSIPNAMK